MFLFIVFVCWFVTKGSHSPGGLAGSRFAMQLKMLLNSYFPCSRLPAGVTAAVCYRTWLPELKRLSLMCYATLGKLI